jgi:hypothetical protein
MGQNGVFDSDHSRTQKSALTIWNAFCGLFAASASPTQKLIYEELDINGNPTGRLNLADRDEELLVAPPAFSWPPLSNLSAGELRARAVEYRRMAATATTTDVRDSLCRIADRFDARAEGKAKRA